MICITVPGCEPLRLQHLVSDINGTLTTDGALLPGVAERIEALKGLLQVTLMSADTFGTARDVADALGVELVALREGAGGPQKLDLVNGLGPDCVVAIGNGANDALMVEAAGLGVVVLQAEGAAASALRRADVVFTSICDALDALLTPSRLTATLRA